MRRDPCVAWAPADGCDRRHGPLEKLKAQARERLHPRKLRSFAEAAFQ
jgi:hypothetical protein